jgi:hypothetical protein
MKQQKNIKILKSIAKEVSDKLHCDRYGSCVHFAEIFVDEVNKQYPELLNNFDVIEGYVNTKIGEGRPQQHTWIRLENDEIIDPTFLQFTTHDVKSSYSVKKSKIYSGQEYYDEGKEGSWFSERRKQQPKTVFKEGSRELIKKVLKEGSNRSKKIENFLNKTLVKTHKDLLCCVKAKKSPYKSFGYGYDVTYFFLRKVLTSEKNNIIDTGWNMVYDTFGESSQIYIQFVDDCDDVSDDVITLTESKNVSTFFKRRIDHHKFEKMLRQGISYIFYDSSSLKEFKWKLVEATLQNYIHYKYDFDIDELPKDEVDNYIKYMIDLYDPLLFRYYHNQKK